jgi:phosphatidylinositol alpha-1,6-mannosyltransferase
MRIGVLTTSYPRGAGDFAGGFVADRVDALLAEGHAVEVLAAAGNAPLGTHRAGRFMLTRLPASFAGGPDLFAGAGAPEALEGGGFAAHWGAARFSTELAAAVAARARASGWDRIESHWLVPCALAAVTGAPGVPHRATAHSGDVALLERMPFGRPLARLLARSDAELVFVSASLRARFAALAGSARFAALAGCARGVVAPLVPRVPAASREAPRDESARAALGLRPGPTVVSVARLVPIKGLDLLVRACAPRPDDAAPIQLVIVGDGPERDRLSQLAARLGVSLRLTGQVARDEVRVWLRAADVYAQPSRTLANGRSEGTPLATLEAISAGVPVVVSDSGGLAELPAGGAGAVIVPAGDIRLLARAIRSGLARRRARAAAIVTAV